MKNSYFDQNIPAAGVMERAPIGGFLARLGIDPQTAGDPIVRALLEDPDAVNKRVFALSDIALRLLPIGTLDAREKAIYGRLNYPGLNTFVLNIADMVRFVAAVGITFDVPLEQMAELLKQKGAYETCKLLGMQMTNTAMDRRALVGAFQGFLLDQIVGTLDRMFHDPKRSRDDQGRLLDHFGPALLSLDAALQQPVVRKAELLARRKDLAAQARAAQEDAALAQTMLDLRQQIVMPREQLFAAAKRHLAQKGAPQGPGPGHGHGHGHPHVAPVTDAGPAVLPTGPGKTRRIF